MYTVCRNILVQLVRDESPENEAEPLVLVDEHPVEKQTADTSKWYEIDCALKGNKRRGNWSIATVGDTTIHNNDGGCSRRKGIPDTLELRINGC